MATYATYSDVNGRMPYWTISVSSTPTSTQVELWLVYAESSLIGALQSGGNPGTYSSTASVAQLREWCCDYAEGRCRQAHASSRGDAIDNGDGQNLLDDFRDLIRDIQNNPPLYGAMLGAGNAPTGTSKLLSYQTSNDDDKTVSDGDFTPQYTRSEVF